VVSTIVIYWRDRIIEKKVFYLVTIKVTMNITEMSLMLITG